MFIEKLTKKNLKCILGETIKVLGYDYLPEMTGIIKDESCIEITFTASFEDQSLFITDFLACYSFGGHGSEEKIQKIFLQCMYRFFGKKFILAYKKHIKEKHDKTVEEFMAKENLKYAEKIDEINEIEQG